MTTLTKLNYDDYAEAFCNDLLKHSKTINYTAVFWNDDFYLYNGKQYVLARDFGQRIRSWMRANNYPQSNFVVGNVLPIVANLLYQDRQRWKEMPFYLGDDPAFPQPRNIIAYQNGLLDLQSFLQGKDTLLPHTPEWVSTVVLPYAYDPTAKCPQWESFLMEVFEDDTDQIKLLQEWAGYCQTQDTSLQKFMVFLGPPRTSKSTAQKVLEGVVGRDAAVGFSLLSLGREFGLHQLAGKLLATCSEVELTGCSQKGMILERLKGIIGEDRQEINIKYKETISTKIPARILIACNEMPTLYETTGALASRLLCLRFNRSCEGREDPFLLDKLLDELPGIANWGLQGLKRLRTNGRFSPVCEKVVNEFRRNNSPILGFIQDRLLVDRTLNSGNLVGVQLADGPISATKGAVEKAYQQWGQDESKTTDTSFLWKRIKGVIPKLEPKPNTRGENKVYLGIGIIPTIV